MMRSLRLVLVALRAFPVATTAQTPDTRPVRPVRERHHRVSGDDDHPHPGWVRHARPHPQAAQLQPVHPQNTQAFIDALIRAGKTFEMMYYPMRKHDIGDRDANVHLYRTMLDFWKRRL